MGKKGSLFSAITRFCTWNSKQKAAHEAGKKSLKEKKGLKHGGVIYFSDVLIRCSQWAVGTTIDLRR
ncbi:hypothetical protein L1887_36231 [Cichorium endivia]|nr:hypothetical protein L1887_36231 [Cichorium endivia]